MSPVYLGDGAYIRLDPKTGEIIVYTDDGTGPTNEVFFDRRGALNLHAEVAPTVSDAEQLANLLFASRDGAERAR